nr:hypothetical protein [Tanacetum cinerariifolium]
MYLQKKKKTCVSLALGVTPRASSSVRLPGGTLLVQCLRDAWDGVSGGMSGLGLWDEDNTCWTGSFLVSSSSYAKSLSSHVLMWSLIVRPPATSWALFGHVQLLAYGLPWNAVSTRVLHYDNGRLRLRHRASRRFPFSMRERLSLFLLGMSESEPGEMAPESSHAMVLLKFDVHVYTSILTTKELKEAIIEYCIPTDLHPRLPPPDLTMNKLSSKYTGIYIEQLKQGGRRAILDAMPWRHIDTGLRDDFPLHYNEDDVARLAEFVIPLRPPPLLTMDAFLKLPVWTGTVVRKGDPIPDGERPKLRTTPPLAARQLIHENSPTQKNLEKPNLKIAAAREKKDQAYKELVSHLATPVEDEFLGSLSNVEVLADAKGQAKVLEGEKAALVAELAQAEVDHHKLVQEFIPTVVRKLHTSVEYRKRLATPVSLCFISDWLGGLSMRKNKDQIAVMLSETRELDIEGVKSWEAMHRNVSCTLEHDFMLIR